MESIRPLWERMPARPFRQTDFMPSGGTGQASAFGKLFTDALRNVNSAANYHNIITDIFSASVNAVRETDTEKNQMEYLMATGQLDNPAPLMIATAKAQIAVDLLVQLRNRATDAYNELMRISL